MGNLITKAQILPLRLGCINTFLTIYELDTTIGINNRNTEKGKMLK